MTAVWVASMNRGVRYHRLETDRARTTSCGRYVGDPGDDEGYPHRGEIVTLEQSPGLGGPCGQCFGERQRHTYPVIRPSRERLR